MFLFPVGQLVADDEGQFVFVVGQFFKGPDVDTQIVSQGAEGVERCIVVDKILVRFRRNGRFRILGRDGLAEAPHDAVQHGVGRGVRIDAVFFLDLSEVFIPAFRLDVMDLPVQIGILGPDLQDGDRPGAPVEGLRRRGQGRCPQGQDQGCRGHGGLGKQGFPHINHSFIKAREGLSCSGSNSCCPYYSIFRGQERRFFQKQGDS